MIVTVEEVKEWLKVEGNSEDALIESFIAATEDICEGVLRFSMSEFDVIPESIKQAVLYGISQFYELRDSMDIGVLLQTIKGLLFAYRKEEW